MLDLVRAAAAPAAAPMPTPTWSLGRRLGFRFTFAFFVLWIEPFPLDALPYTDVLGRPSELAWNAVTRWCGRLFLHRTLDVGPNGSGDTTVGWLQLAILLGASLAATLVWSLLDRRRARYERLAQWLRIYVRFAVGAIMMSYGVAKLFHTQFPFPTPSKLEQPYGDASPMGLLWTFMGFSAPYNVFTGLAEAVPAVLLFFRRTSTLGALLLAAALTNVVLLNFCYDVPVKIFSTELLVASVYIAAPRLVALFDLLVRERAVAAAPPPPPLFARPRLQLAARLVAVAFAAWIGGSNLWRGHTRAREVASFGVTLTGLAGSWEVDSFTRDGVAVPPLEPSRWRSAGISDYKTFGRIAYRQNDDAYDRLGFSRNPDGKTLAIESGAEGAQSTWQYAQADADHLALSGPLDGHALAVTLHRRVGPPRTFRLVTRGFHWINETPYNR